MKRIITFLFIWLIIVCSVFSAVSVSIDGYDGGTEWSSAETKLILNGESNCKVDFGLIKWIFDYETNTVYFCVMFSEPNLASDNQNVGAYLQVDDSAPFTVTVSSAPNEIDVDKYYFDGAVSIDENNGVTCEIRLGFKYGIPQVINGKLRFIDSDGVPSNVYDFTIESSEPTTASRKSSYAGNNTYITTAKSKETTASGTTKATTDKASTEKNGGNDYVLGLLDLLIPEETTKIPSDKSTISTVKSSAAKAKSSKSDTKSSGNSSSVHTTESYPTEELTVNETAGLTDEQSAVKSDITLSQGNKYKTITLIAGGITLVAIAVLGTLKANKNTKNKENDPMP